MVELGHYAQPLLSASGSFTHCFQVQPGPLAREADSLTLASCSIPIECKRQFDHLLPLFRGVV